jgi:hypothetical protein
MTIVTGFVARHLVNRLPVRRGDIAGLGPEAVAEQGRLADSQGPLDWNNENGCRKISGSH